MKRKIIEIMDFWSQTLLACKSDPVELPKSWFSVNNITENHH